MADEQAPRLRMFAGPNGSGKSTLKTMLRPELLARYINPDEIEAAIGANGFFDFTDWNLTLEERELREFFAASTLLKKADLRAQSARLPFQDGQLRFAPGEINSYFASVIADFVRRKFVAERRSFTFETVMSSPDKIEFLRDVRQNGFRIYLYFVATEDPEINVSRVESRVRAGGHDVPHDKIIARYNRSLELLAEALRVADRAYIFDNSGPDLKWIAEFENRRMRLIPLKSAEPLWFGTHVRRQVKIPTCLI